MWGKAEIQRVKCSALPCTRHTFRKRLLPLESMPFAKCKAPRHHLSRPRAKRTRLHMLILQSRYGRSKHHVNIARNNLFLWLKSHWSPRQNTRPGSRSYHEILGMVGPSVRLGFLVLSQGCQWHSSSSFQFFYHHHSMYCKATTYHP